MCRHERAEPARRTSLPAACSHARSAGQRYVAGVGRVDESNLCARVHRDSHSLRCAGSDHRIMSPGCSPIYKLPQTWHDGCPRIAPYRSLAAYLPCSSFQSACDGLGAPRIQSDRIHGRVVPRHDRSMPHGQTVASGRLPRNTLPGRQCALAIVPVI